jgi:hypothetical protein
LLAPETPNKAKLFRWIVDLFEKYSEMLAADTANVKEYLQIMVNLGFTSTAMHLRDLLLEKLRCGKVEKERTKDV